jgi:ATP-binding cassette, subfamily B, bacterial
MRVMLPEIKNPIKLGQAKETFIVSVRLMKFIWRVDQKMFLVSLLSYTLPALIPFVNFYVYKLMIDLVVKVIAGGQLNLNELYLLFGVRILTYFLQDAAFRTQSLISRLYWTKIPIYLNDIVWRKTANLDMYYYESSNFKDLLEKCRESIAWKPQQLTEGLFISLQSLIQLVVAFIAIAKLSWILMVIIALVAIPEFLVQLQLSRLSWGVWSQNSPYRKKFWYISSLLQRSWEIKEVKIFQLAERFLEELKGIQTKFYRENAVLAKKNFAINLSFNSLTTLIYIGVEIFVIIQALAKKITVGDINFYTGVVSNFQNGLSGVFSNMRGVFESSLYVKSIFDVVDLEPVIRTSANPVPVEWKKAPVIEFRNVTFSYPESKKKILNNFSLIIDPGEKVAFVGRNGVGKTTMIKLLARFYDVTEGEILINGVNLKDVNLDDWHKTLGVLFQDFNKYEHTAKENIEFGRIFEKVQLEEIIGAATSAGAHEMINKFDKGYEQMLGKTFEGGLDISGGQWQKMALSRAFLRNAPVLVLDDPTAAIDAKAESEIFDRVEKLSKDKTVIIISHRFSTVRNADKIYVIDHGKVKESGSHEELMKLDGQYAKLFKLQAKGYQ